MLYVVAVFAPLIGAMISGLLGRVTGDRVAQGASILGMSSPRSAGRSRSSSSSTVT